MAYIKNYTYDIFISYAHLDNEKFSGQAVGWIEQFFINLNILLARRVGRSDMIKIWWDKKKLDGNVLFDHSIAEGIRQSAIMICLTSPGYLSSDYCKQELDLFYKKAQHEPVGLKIGDRSRILNVLLNNIPHPQWPKEFSGTSGFHFHTDVEADDLGDPLDIDEHEFKIQLQHLRDSILKLINDFPKEEIPIPVPVSVQEVKEEKSNEDKYTIFLGDVPDSLRSIRKRTINELEKKGYNIIFDVPPPFEVAAHEKAVMEKLELSDLSVHLLDQYPGREIEKEENDWYPKKQAELALKHSKSKLIWLPSEVDIEEVEEEPYRFFLQDLENGTRVNENLEYIRGAKSTLAQEIIDMIEQLKMQQTQKEAPEKMSVLLDTHYNDQLYALELSKSLLENHIQPFINPQEDDPRKNINVLSERIKQVRKLVFFYGNVSRDWVLERMSAALQLIVTNNYPVEEFFIFMVPPHKEQNDIALKQRFLKVNIINNSDELQLSAQAIHNFLKDIKL